MMTPDQFMELISTLNKLCLILALEGTGIGIALLSLISGLKGKNE